MNISRLIPIGESLPLIGLRKSAVYDLIRGGQLQGTKIGRKTFLEESEIARFRAENATKIGRDASATGKGA